MTDYASPSDGLHAAVASLHKCASLALEFRRCCANTFPPSLPFRHRRLFLSPLGQTSSMVGESPILALALVIGTPVLLRYASVLRSTSRPRLRRKVGGPAEALLLLVLTATALYHIWTLSPFSTSHRRARDIFRLTGLPIGAPSASLRARTTTLTPHDLGLQSLAATAGEEDSNEGDAIERLLHRLSSMAGRVSIG